MSGGGLLASRTSAIWNCVYYNVHTYQQSIIQQMPALIAAAHAQIDPRANIGGAPAILERLRSAVKVVVGWTSGDVDPGGCRGGGLVDRRRRSSLERRH